MAYEPEIIIDRDHLVVISRGEFDIDGGGRRSADLIREARASGLSWILADNRQLARPLADPLNAIGLDAATFSDTDAVSEWLGVSHGS